MSTNPRLIAIVGPTASGKTTLAVELAKEFNGEIISADSRQLYRGMDIGTGKATAEEMRGIPHYLLDIKNPGEDYTAADFKKDAEAAINGVLKKGRLPFLVGGTGLYLRAVVENLDIPQIKADPTLRKEIENDIEKHGLEAVFQTLLALDPDAEQVVDRKNPRRVVRALEVALLTGQPLTSQRKASAKRYDTLTLGLDLPLAMLRERIDRRVDQMFASGLLYEVKALVEQYGENAKAFDTIGYKEVIRHLHGESTLPEAIAEVKMDTWHYAKRQRTWFKKEKNIQRVTEPDQAKRLIKEFLK